MVSGRQFLSVGSPSIPTWVRVLGRRSARSSTRLTPPWTGPAKLSFDALTTPERLRILARLEKIARRLPVPGHALINQLVQHATPMELGGKLSHALADRLRITRGEASRRVAEAADLGPRRALTGEPLAPRLPATAAAQREAARSAPATWR